MALQKPYSKGRLIKRFNSLGPYLREKQCLDDTFFFDCLAVCVNTKPSPDKREFWGWWMELRRTKGDFLYSYHYGLYDKTGAWKPQIIKNDGVKKQLKETFEHFLSKLSHLMTELKLELHHCTDNRSTEAETS